MDAQGLGRTHPLTPTRRLKQHTHAYNPGRTHPLTPTRRLKQHTHAYNPTCPHVHSAKSPGT